MTLVTRKIPLLRELPIGIAPVRFCAVSLGEARIDLIQLRKFCQAMCTTLPVFVRRLEKRLNGGD